MTHHDIYDWDANAPPTLIEVNKDGKKIPAIAQSTKQGYMFILDRLTGKAVFGDEERPVPQSDAPGEPSSATQPYPLKPVPISRVSMTRDEVSKISPETIASCQAQYDKAVQMGPNTPYLMVPSLVFPSSEGGGSWSGASFDPTTGYILVNTCNLGTMGALRPQKSSGLLPSYANQKINFDDPNGYPCSAAPWGELMAIDANTADVDGASRSASTRNSPPRVSPRPEPPTPVAPSSLVAASSLSAQLPTSCSAPSTRRPAKNSGPPSFPKNAVNTPMTYQGKNGKQYVAAIISSGLDNFNMPKVESGTNKIIIFTLP